MLVYSAIASLDGYVNDSSGGFGWAMPDAEVHAAVNDAERGIGTYLYGRRLYEVMSYWEQPPDDEDDPVFRDYAALWQAADKVVYSTTLPAVTTARTRLERSFDPDAVRALVAAAPRDVSVGGPGLAAQALRAGLVDRCHLYVVPVVVGGGTPWLPTDVRIDVDLVDVRRFGNGFVHLGYTVRAPERTPGLA